jgi:4-coumarate--CoA ligase
MSIVYRSPLADVALPTHRSLQEYVFEHFDAHADKTLYIDANTEETVTYGEFRSRVQRAAAGFHGEGLRAGETVAVLAPNCIEYGVSYYAALMNGGTL